MGSAIKFKLVLLIAIIQGLALSAFTGQAIHSPLMRPLSRLIDEPILTNFLTNPVNQSTLVSEVITTDDKSGISDEAGFISTTAEDTNYAAVGSTENLHSLESFSNLIYNGDRNAVRGIYTLNGLALRVIQQPAGNPTYVSSIENVITQFSQAAEKNIIGLLAHNFAAGRYFTNLQPGNIIQVIYGDGSHLDYSVTEISRYRAVQPDSPLTSLVNLDNGEVLSAEQAFFKVYSGQHHLTLQTCIAQDGNNTWGRLFILAYPINTIPVGGH